MRLSPPSSHVPSAPTPAPLALVHPPPPVTPPPKQKYALRDNYRSSARIVDAASALIAPNDDWERSGLRALRPAGCAIEVREGAATAAAAAAAAAAMAATATATMLLAAAVSLRAVWLSLLASTSHAAVLLCGAAQVHHVADSYQEARHIASEIERFARQ